MFKIHEIKSSSLYKCPEPLNTKEDLSGWPQNDSQDWFQEAVECSTNEQQNNSRILNLPPRATKNKRVESAQLNNITKSKVNQNQGTQRLKFLNEQNNRLQITRKNSLDTTKLKQQEQFRTLAMTSNSINRRSAPYNRTETDRPKVTQTKDLKNLMHFLQMEDGNKAKYAKHTTVNLISPSEDRKLTLDDCIKQTQQNQKLESSMQIMSSQTSPKNQKHQALSGRLQQIDTPQNPLQNQRIQQQYEHLYQYKHLPNLLKLDKGNLQQLDKEERGKSSSPNNLIQPKIVKSARIDSIINQKQAKIARQPIKIKINSQAKIQSILADSNFFKNTFNQLPVDRVIEQPEKIYEDEMTKFIKIEMNCLSEFNERKKKINNREKSLKKKFGFIRFR